MLRKNIGTNKVKSKALWVRSLFSPFFFLNLLSPEGYRVHDLSGYFLLKWVVVRIFQIGGEEVKDVPSPRQFPFQVQPMACSVRGGTWLRWFLCCLSYRCIIL